MQRGRIRVRQRGRYTGRGRQRQAGRKEGRQVCMHAGKKAGRQHADRQVGGHRQADRLEDRCREEGKGQGRQTIRDGASC